MRPKELSLSSIRSAIDGLLSSENDKLSSQKIRVRRATINDLEAIHHYLSSRQANVVPLATLQEDFSSIDKKGVHVHPICILLEVERENGSESLLSAASLWSFGYSTWKARVMNLDTFIADAEEHEQILMQCLVNIAKLLECKRIVHQVRLRSFLSAFRIRMGLN